MSVVIICVEQKMFCVHFLHDFVVSFIHLWKRQVDVHTYLCVIFLWRRTLSFSLSVSILRTLCKHVTLRYWYSNSVAPLDKRFMYVLWIFYVQWHHVFVLKINFVLIGYSFSDLQWAVTLIGWFIISLINIQLCTLCHTLLAAITNHEMSVFQNNYG